MPRTFLSRYIVISNLLFHMMKHLLILLFLTNVQSFVHQKTNERIFNGSEASLNAFPWMVSVRFNLFGVLKTDCGGVILSDIFVLTAASCFQDLYCPYTIYLQLKLVYTILSMEVKQQNKFA